MGLRPETIERQEFETANGQKFWYYSRVKLTFSWSEEKKDREKRWFCVVPDLFAPVILPNDFITRRKDVLKLANRRRTAKSFIAAMSFPWRRKSQKEEDKKQADDVRQKNKDKEDDSAKARRSELEQRYGISSNANAPGSAPAPAPVAAPTTGSSGPSLIAQHASQPIVSTNTTQTGLAQPAVPGQPA
jgi:hypothetical protein